MRKLILVFALIPLMSFAQYGQRGAGGGSTFYWSLTGQAQKTDSLRIIQGSNMTITQSGNTVTFNGAAGAGSTANVRANTGWTSNGTTAQDTLATVYRLDKANIRFIVTDADGDTLWFYPQNLLPFVLKDGTTILAAIDSTGRAGFGTSTSGQATRATLNVLGRAANDTLAIFSNDGGGVVGDSAIFILGNGSIKSGSNYLNVAATYGLQTGLLLLENTTGLRGNDYNQSVDIIGHTGGIVITSTNSKNIRLTPAAQLLVGASTKSSQGYVTVNANGTADTTFMVRNDKNATLDSTLMLHANADLQSGSRAGFGVGTSGQGARAILNVASRAGGDTVVVLTAESNYGVGDSSWIMLPSGVLKSTLGTASTTVLQAGSAAIGNFSSGGAYARFMHQARTDNDAALVQGSSGDTYIQAAAGQSISLRINGATALPATLHSTGYFSVGYAASQALLQARPRIGVTSDTLFMVRNDNNSALDSTFLVFPTGRISRTDAKALPAAGWVGTAANAPALDTVAYIVGYQFDKATAETLTVDFELPSVFSTISSINVEVINPNTAGDSVAFSVAWLGRADGEDMTVAFSSALSDTIDLGTTQDARKILTITGSFTNLAANDRLILKLWRDPSISDDVDSDVFLTEVKVNGVGLLR